MFTCIKKCILLETRERQEGMGRTVGGGSDLLREGKPGSLDDRAVAKHSCRVGRRSFSQAG